MDYAALDDEALMRLLAYGREEALSVLYDRYSRLVFSLAVRIVGDQATAEEVTLDVFARIWDKAGTYRADRAKVSTWLTSIARNRAIDVLRRRGVRPERDSIGLSDLRMSAQPSNDSTEEDVEQRLQHGRVLLALAELPAEQREALALAYYQGYSQSEIAQVLGLPLGTVKSRIRLAMSRLRDLLVDASAA